MVSSFQRKIERERRRLRMQYWLLTAACIVLSPFWILDRIERLCVKLNPQIERIRYPFRVAFAIVAVLCIKVLLES